MLQAINASAGGAFLGGSAAGLVKGLAGARLVAGANAATAVIRETDGSGRILLSLSAPAANAVDESFPPAPIAFAGNVHVTLTGTTPHLSLFA
jgi:hypothetical protein